MRILKQKNEEAVKASSQFDILFRKNQLPEVADDAALLVDPFSEASIAEGMTEMLDENVRRALIEKGVERAKDFSWDKAAEGIWNCLMRSVDHD